MISKYIVPFLIILLLYLVFTSVDFTYKSPENKKLEPNLVLLDADIEHFLQGELGFKVKAKKIEMYDKLFVMYESTIDSEKGFTISANVINFYPDNDVVYASSNVYFKHGRHVYRGNELEYDMKRYLLKTFRGGELTLND